MIFGEVSSETMQCHPYGNIVSEDWLALPSHFPSLFVKEFVVMPNHLHGIIAFEGLNITVSLSSVIGSFKSGVAKKINALRETPGEAIWQRSYHDHLIRTEAELLHIQEYILANPLKWAADTENPNKLTNDQPK